VVTLRFDLGGIGDSAPEPSARPLKARTELEIQAALDHLYGHYDLHGIALGGLCSGAEDSLRSARADPRVTRVVLIDPFAYRTWGWAWRHVLNRIARRGLRGLGLYRPLTLPKTQDTGERVVRYQYMAHAEAKEILQALLKRGVRVHFLYTGGAQEVFNHEAQLQAQFRDLDFAGLVSCDYLPSMDHTQLLEADRRALIEAISSRLRGSARDSAP
jgi:pimeloyl-ACP methyl ester carboxylesterase